MKVYSVLEDVDYEGQCLIGVFGSREEAVEFVKSQDGYKREHGDVSYGVVESELGQEVDYYSMVEYVE
jgi:hypothetical protein